MWEAMLYRPLTSLGYAVRNCCGPGGQDGPDFCFDANGRTIWVEAVVPAPTDIPDDYLAFPKPGEVLSGTKPDQPRVLRCTSVIADKKAKFQNYRLEGIVAPDDYVIIAVNI